jgi:predicted dehydrogenase
MRIGLAGVGRFGQLHAAVLAQLPGVQLAAIADPSAERRNQVADRHGVTKRTAAAEELFSDPELDAFVIVTPDEQHGRQGLAAVATGKPVFIEKPLAASWEEARQLQRAAVASGSLLQTGLVLRYELQHGLLQEEVAAGRFGELVSMRVKRNCSAAWFATVADRAHTVFETLIHDIDLLLWFSGSQATRVMAMERRFGSHLSPEGCFALIQFASGCVGIAETSWFVPAQAPANVLADGWRGTIDAELALVGTRQSAQLRLLEGPLQIWGEQGPRNPDGLLWPERQGRVLGALQAELADFVASARSGLPSATASLEHAVEGLRIAEAIVESAHTGQAVMLEHC